MLFNLNFTVFLLSLSVRCVLIGINYWQFTQFDLKFRLLRRMWMKYALITLQLIRFVSIVVELSANDKNTVGASPIFELLILGECVWVCAGDWGKWDIEKLFYDLLTQVAKSSDEVKLPIDCVSCCLQWERKRRILSSKMFNVCSSHFFSRLQRFLAEHYIRADGGYWAVHIQTLRIPESVRLEQKLEEGRELPSSMVEK